MWLIVGVNDLFIWLDEELIGLIETNVDDVVSEDRDVLFCYIKIYSYIICIVVTIHDELVESDGMRIRHGEEVFSHARRDHPLCAEPLCAEVHTRKVLLTHVEEDWVCLTLTAHAGNPSDLTLIPSLAYPAAILEHTVTCLPYSLLADIGAAANALGYVGLPLVLLGLLYGYEESLGVHVPLISSEVKSVDGLIVSETFSYCQRIRQIEVIEGYVHVYDFTLPL